ncbi:hypothetical protein BD311DRAFT_211588 [Dichomitus squalens]|uniref:Uncharacterized protein n=1 Tax=Dichomitus squalens TaxID=114155 RepID=A0A4Q9N7H7_9APHY|nr:hypothetical protein BD311DRAFT_211588 [Dichomitus squalens]
MVQSQRALLSQGSTTVGAVLRTVASSAFAKSRVADGIEIALECIVQFSLSNCAPFTFRESCASALESIRVYV